jgi:ATP-dependent protease ClpP protease subunit
MNRFPYDLYSLDCHSLSYHALARFKQLLQRDMMIPSDIADQIEENIIPALEYIEGWEPSDSDIQAHIESRGVF